MISEKMINQTEIDNNEFIDHFKYLQEKIGVNVSNDYDPEIHILTKFEQIGELYKDNDKSQYNYILKIIACLNAYGIEKPSNVQSLAILPMLSCRDCIVQAQSGSGKTLTFLTIAMTRIKPSIKNMQVLIITNSRELAHQIFLVGVTAFKSTGVTFGLHIGGTKNDSYYNQDNYLDKDISSFNGKFNEQIVIGTPGRIKDLLDNRVKKRYSHLNNDDLSLLILDEVDQLLSSGLLKTTRETMMEHIKEKVQIGIFSATMPTSILDITDKFMNKPIQILIPEQHVNLAGIKQYYIDCQEDEYKIESLLDILPSFNDKIGMIFVNSIKSLNLVNEELKKNKMNILAISSELTQVERFQIMDDFKNNRKYNFLLTTDVLARGIDIHQISLVINFDIPYKPETYIHRIGRTGRFGRTGTVLNLVGSDKDTINNYIKKYAIDMTQI